jgi:uncharacterized LabA/DUF88 family protein
MATAILVDGAFFLRRLRYSFPTVDRSDPSAVAAALRWQVFWHLALRIGPTAVNQLVADQRLLAEWEQFYRIFFYDCRPLTKRMHTPIVHRSVDFSKTSEAVFRLNLHQEILKLRKVALRLGRLNDTSKWRLSESATQRLTDNPTSFVPTDSDFEIDTKQKGVDMRLGLDVASLAFKRQVDQIVLVAADADFVPAVKLARREGIDVVLDRMGDRSAARDLLEHVDGIRDCSQSDPRIPV